MGDTTIEVPSVQAEGQLSNGVITAEGDANLADVDLDIDGFLAPIGERKAKLGDLKVGYELFDFDFGPDIDMYERVEFEPEIFVTLVFDKQVEADGVLVTELTTSIADLDAIDLKILAAT